ncbi:MAG: glycosyltransferase [bacterium]
MILECTVGLTAYNEEANIGKLLTVMLQQKLVSVRIKEILVVASGCTDRTVEIAGEFEKKHPSVKLLIQEKREGKSSAINLIIREAATDIIVIESADTLPTSNTVENLVTPFADPETGMTGARPIPINSMASFMGYCANFLWNMHHNLALRSPKLGEMIAFRKVFEKIDSYSAVDEASIEAEITSRGYKIKYARYALVHNKGPDTVADFLKQRRRIACGHYRLHQQDDYATSTMSSSFVLLIFYAKIDWHFKQLKKLFFRKRYSLLAGFITAHFIRAVWIVGAILLEVLGRALGWYDYNVLGKNPFVWDIAATTKKLKE